MSEKKKPLKAFGYIRVSTEMQVEEGYSLDNQEYEITEHAKKEGMRLERIYRDATDILGLKQNPTKRASL